MEFPGSSKTLWHSNHKFEGWLPLDHPRGVWSPPYICRKSYFWCTNYFLNGWGIENVHHLSYILFPRLIRLTFPHEAFIFRIQCVICLVRLVAYSILLPLRGGGVLAWDYFHAWGRVLFLNHVNFSTNISTSGFLESTSRSHTLDRDIHRYDDLASCDIVTIWSCLIESPLGVWGYRMILVW